MGSQDVSKANASYIKYNYLDNSYLDPSIHPSPAGEMDRGDCKAQLKKRIGYEHLKAMYDVEDMLDNLEIGSRTTSQGRYPGPPYGTGRASTGF